MGAPTKYPPPNRFDDFMLLLSGPIVPYTLFALWLLAMVVGLPLFLIFVAGGCC